jgi:hypothetical protein
VWGSARYLYGPMARPLCLDREDMFDHVLNRGNERRAIFRDEADMGDHYYPLVPEIGDFRLRRLWASSRDSG